MRNFILLLLIFCLLSCQKTLTNEISNTTFQENKIKIIQTNYENKIKNNSLTTKKEFQQANPKWRETSELPNENYLTPIFSKQNIKVFLKTTFEKNETISYTIIFLKNDEKFLNTESENFSIKNMLEDKTKTANLSLSFVETDLNLNVLSNYRIKNGVKIKEKNAVKFLNSFDAKDLNINGSNIDGEQPYGVEDNCTYWYWVVYNEDGDIISSEYAYSICTPSGGGSGGSGEDTSDEPVTLESIFNSYINSRTPDNIFSPYSSGDNQDPNCGTQTWTIVEGAIANWRVIANTQYCFIHDKYYNITTNSISHKFNFQSYETGPSYFTGSNSLISSTWTETSKSDQILNNNTAEAKGKTLIVGTIRHVLLRSIPIIENLDVTNNVSNGVFISPGY